MINSISSTGRCNVNVQPLRKGQKSDNPSFNGSIAIKGLSLSQTFVDDIMLEKPYPMSVTQHDEKETTFTVPTDKASPEEIRQRDVQLANILLSGVGIKVETPE